MTDTSIIDFNLSLLDQESALNLTEDAIIYAAQVTQNQLVDTSLNSSFRFLLEAQTYIYGKILDKLNVGNVALQEALYKILGYQIEGQKNAQALLKFELLSTFDAPVFIPKAFPVGSTAGILFLTDETLVIAAGSRLGYISATAIIGGESTNVPAGTITRAKKILTFDFLVTNESAAHGGSSQQTLVEAQRDLALQISNTSVVNAENYAYRLGLLNPNYFCTVTSQSAFAVSIYVGKKDGTTLIDSELDNIKSYITGIKHIGVERLEVLALQIMPIALEVVISVDDPLSFTQSGAIADAIRAYLTPGGADYKKYKGVIILENVKRVISNFSFNYIQTVKIGSTLSTAVGNNYTYNDITEVPELRLIRVTAINDTVVNSKDFSYE